MKPVALLIAATLAVAVCLPEVRAQADTENTIVVTATRTPQTVDATLAAVTVITREEIDASQAQDVPELLRLHAGIDIGRNGGPGQPASVFIRGADSNHTLVLVDGVKINPGTIGGAALQNLDPDLIERIEIVRGPRSTLYGSDAIGGVIQIFTRRGGPGISTQARVGAGSDATRDGSLGAHYRQGDVRAGVDLASFRTDGFPARIDGPRDNGNRNRSANAYAGVAFGGIDAEINHWQARGNIEYFDFFLSPLDQDFINAVTALTLKAAAATNWASTLKLSHMRDEIDQNQSSDFAHTRRDQLDWQNDVQLPRDHLLTLGLHLSREHTEALSFGTAFDVDTDTDALFVQDQWRTGDHQILAALRYNDHESFGNHTTGELAYGRRITPTTQWRASIGTGFRAPDSTDRFGFGGNPALEPETSRSLEIGARFALTSAQSLDLVAFQNDIDNLILFVDPDGFLGPLPGMNQNVETARIRGIELAYGVTARPWTISVHGIVQDPQNRETGKQLARRAKQSLTTGLRYQRGAYQAGLDLLATSKRPDSDFSDTVNPGYGIFNLTAQYALRRDWMFRARIENLLDKDYVLADGFNIQGRALFVQIQYRYATGARAAP